jgi:soluble cytochrome b562
VINLNVDLTAILELGKDLEPTVKKALSEAAGNLALQTHAHIVEKVQKELHSSREKYLGALEFKQVSADTWVINLDKAAMWIEQGQPEHSMLDDLLSSPKAKMSADGSRYVVVPFEHNKGPTRQTQAQNDLTNTIKAEMKKRQIPYGKLEFAADGAPKVGKLHTFNINAPNKTAEGPGQGHGQIGQARQGPTGIPFLRGVSVYQKQIKDQSTGKTKVKKAIMTFRVASSKHQGTERWHHPGTEAKEFFEDAQKWALEQWERKIVPDIMRRLSSANF